MNALLRRRGMMQQTSEEQTFTFGSGFSKNFGTNSWFTDDGETVFNRPFTTGDNGCFVSSETALCDVNVQITITPKKRIYRAFALSCFDGTRNNYRCVKFPESYAWSATPITTTYTVKKGMHLSVSTNFSDTATQDLITIQAEVT